MQHWVQQIQDVLTVQGRAVLVTVALNRGSTPRDSGAHMIVTEDDVINTIGGGNLEFRAIDQARELLKDNDRQVLYQDYPLGPALGQCCGGVASLLFEMVEEGTGSAAWLDQVKAGDVTAIDIENGRRRQFVSIGSEAMPMLPNAVQRAANEFSKDTSDVAIKLLEEEGYLLEKITDPRMPLYVYGAGHVAQALVGMLAALPFKTYVVDNRKDILAEMPDTVSTILADKPEEIVAKTEANAYHLVMTHDHGIDLEITHRILEENRYAYVGLIGSDTKRARFERRLNARGIDRKQLDDLVCPIGIAEITGKMPGQVALSVAAELTILHQQQSTYNKQPINVDRPVSRGSKR